MENLQEEFVSEMNQSETRTEAGQSENSEPAALAAAANVPPKQIEPIMSDSGVSVSSQKMTELEDQIIRQNQTTNGMYLGETWVKLGWNWGETWVRKVWSKYNISTIHCLTRFEDF